MFQKKIKDKKLELIVFVAGSVVMILELIGSRIFAPYLGNSIFVWSSLIGIILGALSLGYYLGGLLSKKNPSLEFLLRILFISGILIILISLSKDAVLTLISPLGVKIGSILTTIILFVPVSILLGMISPYAVRLKIENVADSGSVAGKLYALSTIGSIFGTFLAGFYLIPSFGATHILYGLSLALIFTSCLRGRVIYKFSAVMAICAIWWLHTLPADAIVYEGDSVYNHIRVVDAVYQPMDRDVRILYLATETHSIIFKDGEDLFSRYHHFYLLDRLFKPDVKKALTLGGGAYVAPINFLKRFPGAQMTVVEIDPKVTQVAKDYFGLLDSPNMNIIHGDARIFLNNNREKFDIIYGDAFASFYSVPFHLTTIEAVENIYDSLSDDGIYIQNIISSLTGPKSKYFQAQYQTLRQKFPLVYVVPTRYTLKQGSASHQNILLIAVKDANNFALESLIRRANEEESEILANIITEDQLVFSEAIILKDDFAPVENLIADLLN